MPSRGPLRKGGSRATEQKMPTERTSRSGQPLAEHRDLAPGTMRVWLLGGFRVSVGKRTIREDAWRLRKAAALVKLLALSPNHRLHREQAMDSLWPDLRTRAASNNLRQALHAARRTLDPDASSRYLASEDESLVLCPEGQLWVDVAVFEEAAATARRGKEPAAYRAALELYAGELLPRDRYEEWAERYRRRLRETYLSLLLRLARLEETRGDLDSAIEALRKVVAEEPAREEAYTSLMRLSALLGRKAEAFAYYGQLEKTLLGDLGTEPAASSRDLREEIAAGRFPSKAAREQEIQHEEPAGTGRHNLPAPRNSFVGREQEMLEVKRTLAMTRLLTLTGAGGSGKTRLALEVARDLVGAYPDGVRLVELAGLTESELVPQVVAGALGVQEQPGQPPTDTLVEALRGKEMLLVVDNCEHLLDACARLVDTLLDGCPWLRILATGREALDIGGEVNWSVPTLSVPNLRHSLTVEQLEGYESARLFVDRAWQRNVASVLTSGNARAVAEICAKLDGLPLAIELAAARIKLLPPQAMLARLDSRMKLLRGGARDLPQRQRTLRATIEWSYELLDEGEKRLFARLSVFWGGRTLEAAEAVCDAEGDLPIDVLEGVSSLLDKNLLGQEQEAGGEPRFVMLETIHEYARERLEQSGEAEGIRRLHAEYFLALAERGESKLRGEEEAKWLERLEAEHDNMRSALSWALGGADVELGLRLVGALWLFWDARGHYEEGRKWCEGALEKGKRAVAPRAKVLAGLGYLVNRQGDLGRAEEAAEEGLKLSKEAGIKGVVVPDFLLILGDAAAMRGDHERAKELVEEGLVLSREAGDRRMIAWCLDTLANVLGSQGDYERAKELYEEGLVLSRELSGTETLSAFLISLGYEFLLEGDHERAAALNEEAAELCRERGHRGRLAYALDNLGWAALLRGDHERARKLHEESLMLCRDLGVRVIAAESLEGLACAAGSRGEAERATRLFGAAEALREAVGYWQEHRERALREPYLTAARSRMDQASWESAFAAGQAMVFEEAAEYALSKEADPDRPTFPASEAPSDGQLPVTLTSREQEVAVLVAQGLSNRQIASYLTLSEHTIATHIRNILKKLGLHSRTQIAAYFREQH
jgi:predicted ATPase/DNA-binding SARP family transcriptional activator/DNA-binding CsgD family transcriptional regulator